MRVFSALKYKKTQTSVTWVV